MFTYVIKLKDHNGDRQFYGVCCRHFHFIFRSFFLHYFNSVTYVNVDNTKPVAELLDVCDFQLYQ